MSFRKQFSFIRQQLRNQYSFTSSVQWKMDRKAADLIRNTHSIEKGLCIANPRLGYGHAKQQVMLSLIKDLQHSTSQYHKEAITMAECALKAYLDYHAAMRYSDEMILKIQAFLDERILPENPIHYGGYLTLKKTDLQFNVDEIEKMFRTRHSVRDFADEEVDPELLKKAILLAQTAPSACNRQGVRAYVINHKKASSLQDWLQGTGGFEKSIKEFILITAKKSAYMPHETYQYIVSASIYAAYLTLTLHTYGMGACVVQRSVVTNKVWRELCETLGIPLDEQSICMIGVGVLKNEFRVPVSHRLAENIIIKQL